MVKMTRDELFKGWHGCSNHGCIVHGEFKGMGTNGSCKCLITASRGHLTMLQSRLDGVLRKEEAKSHGKT
jgi:hypothetical protein